MSFLPYAFENRMKRILGADFDAYLSSFDSLPERAFHVNNIKISTENFRKISPFNETKYENRDNCFLFSYEGIGKHPFHHAGMIYVQEPAAMFPVDCIDIKPQWNVLDLCSAPGGKTSQVLNRLSPEGNLVSNEIIPSRCKVLTGNLERLGAKNSTTLCTSPENVADCFGGIFDLVICDVPCSGEGMFRKERNAIPNWSEENVLMCAQRQRSIFSQAQRCVKPGGYLLYSTCTFSEEENEENIMWFINEYPRFKPVKMKDTADAFTVCGTEAAGEYREFMRRFYPHKAKGEGQFAVLLKDTSECEASFSTRSAELPKPEKNEELIARDFLSSVLSDYDFDRFRISKDKLVYVNPDFYVPSRFSYMSGVTVGTFKKGRLEPHHQFFSAFGAEMTNAIDFSVDDIRLNRYLKGESFEAAGEKGWCAVLVNGVALGGAKRVDGYLKNAYPRGLQSL